MDKYPKPNEEWMNALKKVYSPQNVELKFGVVVEVK